MNMSLKTSELFNCNTPYLKELFLQSTYPWDMLPKIKVIEDIFDFFILDAQSFISSSLKELAGIAIEVL